VSERRRLNHRAAIRAAVWDACGGRCTYCGEVMHPFRDFCVDHVIALAAGGSDTLANMTGACRLCNGRKGITTDTDAARAFAQLRPGREVDGSLTLAMLGFVTDDTDAVPSPS
jgi:5-methylcytosine-specific restriction endonuclease McrA